MMFDAEKFISVIHDLAHPDKSLCAYLYDLGALASHARNIKSSLPDRVNFFYAIKANSDLPILSALAEHVDGFEASSGGEIQWVRQNFPDVPLIFSGPGKLDTELELAILNNVTVHIESRFELERLLHIARHYQQPAEILLRVNPHFEDLRATSLMMGGKPTQFGISVEHLSDCLRMVKDNSDCLYFQGFHFHLLSHQLDAAQHLCLLSAYIEQAVKWKEEFNLVIDHINVGGGIGVNYKDIDQQFDWCHFSHGLNNLPIGAAKNIPKIRFEMGRYVSAFCGVYVAEVIDIKTSGNGTYVVVKGGTHHFRTPYAQNHSHPFKVIPISAWKKPYSRPGLRRGKVNIVGQLCTPKDLLAFDEMVDEIRVGDIVLFSHAGAYAWHISHHDFLRHAHPQHIYLPA